MPPTWLSRARAAALGGLAIALAGAQEPLEPPAPRHPAQPGLEIEDAVAALVRPERAQERVRELVALGPRMGGTESGRRAAAWTERAFAAAGLEARALDDPPGWCHEEESWSVRARREGLEARALESAWPYGFSPKASGRAVLGLEPETGGALLDARAPRAAGGGASPAVVLVDGATTLDGSYPVIGHLREGDANRAPVFGLSRAEGELLRGWLAEGAPVEIEFALEARIAKASPRTVIARIPSRNASGEAQGWTAEHLLFCAHGDSDAGGPGADDNASGTAVVLEIASAWSEAIRRGILPPPRREVRFAVWGAEIRSSRAYLERAESLGLPLAVINYDQAGFGSGADQLNVEPDDLPANERLVRAITAVLAQHAGEEGFPARWATNKSLGGTDSYVFSGSKRFREGSRPALTVFSSAWGRPGEHPRTPGMPGESWSEREQVSVDYDLYYHSAGDTPENTTDREPWNMAWCARVGLLGGLRYLELLE